MMRMVGLVLLASAGALAQQPTTPLEAVQIAEGVYYFKGGSGANTGLIVSKSEALVVDAKMTEESARAMLEQVRRLTPNPVKRVILTHSDGDHVNGLGGFPPGIEVLAHPNARRDMEEAFKDPKLSGLQPWLPKQLVSERQTLDLDGLRVELLHFGPAHTDGDLVVLLPQRRVAFVGDLIFIGREPLIHRHKNGSSFGAVATLKKLVTLEADKFVSGHAEPVGKQEIEKLAASLEGTQAKVRSLIAEGKSLDEIKAALGVAEPSSGARRRPGLIEVIYLELTEKK